MYFLKFTKYYKTLVVAPVQQDFKCYKDCCILYINCTKNWNSRGQRASQWKCNFFIDILCHKRCQILWGFVTYLQVTILFANFSADENLTDEGRQSARDINEYNRRYSGEPRPVSGWVQTTRSHQQIEFPWCVNIHFNLLSYQEWSFIMLLILWSLLMKKNIKGIRQVHEAPKKSNKKSKNSRLWPYQ